MEETTIINLLTNSGLKVFGMDGDFVYFEDPSCIFPAFDTVIEYAWLAIVIMVAIMLFGWGALYIKNGIKINTVFNNAKTLILVLATLALVKPIVNIVYGDNLFAKQCEVKQVSLSAVNELLDMRKKKFGKSDEYLLYETFNMIDSGPIYSNDNNDSVETHVDVLTSEEKQRINEQSSSAGFTVGDIASVEVRKGEVIYIKKDGVKIKRSGGSAAWRNNNPGNIIKSEFAYKNGAIGEAGRFAVFPDEETGLRATMKLLRSKNYYSLRLREVYHRWAPSSDGNNPNSYANRVSRMSGISLDTRIQELNDDELRKVARAMQTVEGWYVGTEQRI